MAGSAVAQVRNDFRVHCRVIFDKNPLDDIHNTNTIHWVMKNGELFEGDTLDKVWPEEKKLEPLFFWSSYDVPKSGEPLSYGKTTTP